MLKKDFGKFTSCRNFGANKLDNSRPFLDYPYETSQLLSALCSHVLKKNYRCTSTFTALNYCSGIFFKYLSNLHEVVRTNFSADFWTFRNFGPQFRETRGAT